MFLGHFGAAFGAARPAPRVSLGVLIAAAQLPDLLWPVMLLLGWERAEVDPGNTLVTPIAFIDYPWTHSLLATVGWAFVAGIAYALWARDRRGGAVVGALVLSHWMLDLLVHRPDLPLAPGGDSRLGLGLWNSLPATLLLEAAVFGTGVWLYASVTRARDRIGRWGFWAIVAFLIIVYVANVFGPPPPGMAAVAWAGLAMWLLPIWAWWIDDHRDRRTPGAVAAAPA